MEPKHTDRWIASHYNLTVAEGIVREARERARKILRPDEQLDDSLVQSTASDIINAMLVFELNLIREKITKATT